MDPMIGVSPRKRSSSAIKAAPSPAAAAILVLLGSGALLAALRIGSHMHLHMPGHQGLIRVAALMLAVRVTGLPWAATIMATGAAAVAGLSPAQGFDPTGSLEYLLCGLVIDSSNRLVPQRQLHPIFMAAVGAAANATKPLALWIIAAIGGFSFESLEHGLAFPLAMHLAFGAGAGIGAWMLWQGYEFARRE